MRDEGAMGWMQTYPFETEYHEITLDIVEGSVESAGGYDFGNIPVVTLTGSKWNDEDGDGYWDGVHGYSEEYEEPGIEGWVIVATPMQEVVVDEEESEEEGGGDIQVFLLESPTAPDLEEDIEGDRTTKYATTTEDGIYDFDFLESESGWWRISEVNQAYWSQTYPVEPTYYDVYISPTGSEEYPLPGDTDYEGGVYEYFDFGNWEWPTIQVFKWWDVNGDGIRDWEDIEQEGNTEGVKDDGEEYTDPALSDWRVALGMVTDNEVDEETGITQVDIEIVQLGLTGVDGIAELRVPHPDQDYVVLEGHEENWTPILPVSRDEILNVDFGAFSTDPLIIDSFFDVYVSQLGGQTYLQGQSSNTTEPTAIEFANFFDEPDEEVTESSGGSSGGGGGNGQISGSAPTAPGFVNFGSGGQGGEGGATGGSSGGGSTGGGTTAGTATGNTGTSGGGGIPGGDGNGPVSGDAIAQGAIELGVSPEDAAALGDAAEAITNPDSNEGQVAAAANTIGETLAQYWWLLALLILLLGSAWYAWISYRSM